MLRIGVLHGFPKRSGNSEGYLRFWPPVFVAVFFLPYLGGTRIRFEILLFAVLLGFTFFGIITKKHYFMPLPSHIFLFSAGTFMYTLIWAANSDHAPFINRVIDVINQNFLFITLFGLLPLGRWLRANSLPLLRSIVGIAGIINIIAILQIFLPGLLFHDEVFKFYGGEIGDHGLASAEFLCRVAHRCTSIFPTIQALALFDLLIIALLFYLINSRQIGMSVFWVSMALVFMGGLASVSKTFLIGGPIIFFFMTNRRQLLLFGAVVAIFVILIVAIPMVDFYQDLLGQNLRFIDKISEYGIDYIFSTRFGGAGYEIGVFERIYDSMKEIPNIFWFGVGSDYRYYQVEYVDNLYLQLVIYGGLPYAVLFIVQYLLLFFELARRVSGPARQLVYAIATTHIFIGLAYAVFFIGRYTMLMVVVLLVVTLNFNTKRGVPARAQVNIDKYESETNK